MGMENRLAFSLVQFCAESSTVLQWIYGSENRQQTFIANRVAEILETCQTSQWRPVPESVHPADDKTNRLKVDVFILFPLFSCFMNFQLTNENSIFLNEIEQGGRLPRAYSPPSFTKMRFRRLYAFFYC